MLLSLDLSLLGVGQELLSTHLMQALTTHNIAVLYSWVDCLAWTKPGGLWCDYVTLSSFVRCSAQNLRASRSGILKSTNVQSYNFQSCNVKPRSITVREFVDRYVFSGCTVNLCMHYRPLAKAFNKSTIMSYLLNLWKYIPVELIEILVNLFHCCHIFVKME